MIRTWNKALIQSNVNMITFPLNTWVHLRKREEQKYLKQTNKQEDKSNDILRKQLVKSNYFTINMLH